MTSKEFRRAQRRLGWTNVKLARALGVWPTHVSHMRSQPGTKSHRPVAPTIEILLNLLVQIYCDKTLPVS